MSVDGSEPTLLIGLGSELRRDDAAGRRVVEAVAARRPAGVERRTLHQLTPELAADLAGRRVVVVDASVAVEEVTLEAVTVPAGDGPAAGALSHHLDPGALAALAARLGWRPASMTVVHVPAHDLGVGVGLSPATAAAVATATERVLQALNGGNG